MFIFTDNRNIIQNFSTTMSEQIIYSDDNQTTIIGVNYLLDTGIYLAGWNVNNVYEINENLPEYITFDSTCGTEKYMYTPEDGFFQNPDWVRPPFTTDELQERYDYLLSILTPAQMDAFENEFPEE